MQYNPPTGGAANDPYVGKNVAAGIQGSKIPPTAAEFPQREIVALIAASGQSPTNSDLTQLTKGVRSGVLDFYHDTGTADALVITPSLAFGAIADGNRFTVVKSNAANATTAPTLAVNGLSQTLVKHDGTALAAGDLPAGCVVDVRSLAGQFRVVGLRKSDAAGAVTNITNNQAITLAQILITSFPSISPPKNGRMLTGAGSVTLTIGGTGPNDPPSNVTDVFVEGVGAGGGGAAAGTSGTPWSGGGGGAGGYVADWIRGLTPGSTIALTKGAGGPGGTSGNGHQGSSGTSSTAVGGGKSLTATGGGGGIGGTATCSGGSPGLGTGSTIGANLYGAPGGDGNTTNIAVQGGAGGASYFGGPGRTSTLGSNSGTAANGLAPGSGGGGIWQNGNGTEIGGNGADGAWRVGW